MVARGDLGLEMPLEQVPHVQKDITRRARGRGTPVILATQVLESMTVGPRPTRAEVNDAASAVYDGVDAIMLSGETAVGGFPVKAADTLDAIIREAEKTALAETPAGAGPASNDHAQALCEAAVTLANRGDAQVIVAVTHSGVTARRLSALRPRAPIVAAAESGSLVRRLMLHWGLVPISFDIGEHVEQAALLIRQQLIARGLVQEGSVVVIVNISDNLTRGDANYLKIQRL
jgi:pyruvate kinase